MKKLRIGIIGLGGRVRGDLIKTYAHHPQVEFTAICDKADGLCELTLEEDKDYLPKDVKVYRDYEVMRKEAPYDALLVACDPDVQVDIACDAMERGIHVMTEVPAAYTIEQCQKLVDTVEKTGAKYQLNEQTRYWDFFEKWRQMQQNGEFGKIIYAEGEYLHFEPEWDLFVNIHTGRTVRTNDPSYHQNPDYVPSWRYRFFGHPILYLPHTLSPLLSVTGGRIDYVSCMSTKNESYSFPGFAMRDIETAVMHNTNDVVFNVRASFTSPHGGRWGTGNHWYQIKGSRASVEWQRSTLDTPKLWTPENDWQSMEKEWVVAREDTDDEIKNSGHGGSDWWPITHFIDAVFHDKTPPMDVYKAVETAAPAILAAESADKGGIRLEVPDFRKKSNK